MSMTSEVRVIGWFNKPMMSFLEGRDISLSGIRDERDVYKTHDVADSGLERLDDLCMLWRRLKVWVAHRVGREVRDGRRVDGGGFVVQERLNGAQRRLVLRLSDFDENVWPEVTHTDGSAVE